MPKMNLMVPTGNVINSIIVRVAMDSADSVLRIHGTAKSGLPIYVDVAASSDRVTLPFVNGQIELEAVGGQGFSRLSIECLGWEDRRDI